MALLRVSVEFRGQILLVRVHSFDQRYFLCPSPPLDLFLARDGARGPSVRFEPDEARHVVLLREPGDSLLLVVKHSAHQIIGHARV